MKSQCFDGEPWGGFEGAHCLGHPQGLVGTPLLGPPLFLTQSLCMLEVWRASGASRSVYVFGGWGRVVKDAVLFMEMLVPL